MTSRKKAKGKARKAAKEAKAKEEEEAAAAKKEQKSLEVQMQLLAIDGLLQCRHGFERHDPDPSISREFIFAFSDGCNTKFKSGERDLGILFDAGIIATDEKYAAVWGDVAKMEAVVSFCVAIGTNILDENKHDASFFACLARFFEQRIATDLRKTQHAIKWQHIIELLRADDHTLVKFLRKRIACKCLDEKYKEVKYVTKMGVCSNPRCSLPRRRVERSMMFCCTRCGIFFYCSRECQTAHWPEHKQYCDRYSELKVKFDAEQHANRK